MGMILHPRGQKNLTLLMFKAQIYIYQYIKMYQYFIYCGIKISEEWSNFGEKNVLKVLLRQT